MPFKGTNAVYCEDHKKTHKRILWVENKILCFKRNGGYSNHSELKG
jgi:hypothetical protein